MASGATRAEATPEEAEAYNKAVKEELTRVCNEVDAFFVSLDDEGRPKPVPAEDELPSYVLENLDGVE